ncbi:MULTISPECIES: cobalt transporter CbiM [unclassified Yoonia]|uniref:cobalt transporter CbiM n=1 Tax=unclassified Yoonia TaxID=2629118 RepID=UPI002AFF2F2D|nr:MULTISPECIES: cobalt transporter CbiM [unclassified Yoonia]
MHIPDGILPLGLTLGGWVAAGGLTAISLNRIAAQPDPRAALPRASMMTAAFFAASLIHIPIPPTSVHLMLSGLMGAMLGWYAVPAILIGLAFQAVMFGHGGLTTLGVNGVILGLPALAAFALTRGFGHVGHPIARMLASFATGAGAVLLAVGLFAAFLLAGLPAHLDAGAERTAIMALVIAHLPLALAEGMIVAAVLTFLRRTSPDMIIAR